MCLTKIVAIGDREGGVAVRGSMSGIDRARYQILHRTSPAGSTSREAYLKAAWKIFDKG